METFKASLRAIGDVKALPATVAVDDGQLSLTAGDTEIGTWTINEIDLEPMPTGYRMSVEGDQVVIELTDLDGFTAAIERGQKRRGIGRKKKTPKQSSQPVAVVETPPAPVRTTQSTRQREVALPPAPEPATVEKKKKKKARNGGIIDYVDRTLVKAEKRFGPYLPDWVFTRLMFGMLAAALILVVVLPGLISVIMLVGGLLLVLFGAVVYTDPMLASRLLPGRTAPQHALLFGVLTLMVGVLLGVIAR